MTTQHPLTSFRQQIEESFEKQFGYATYKGVSGDAFETTLIGKGDLKAFILSALTQQLSLVEEEIKKERGRYEGFSVEEIGSEFASPRDYREAGAVSALNALLTRIKSGNEEQKYKNN